MESENFKDFYAILELQFEATRNEVKNRYKKLALQFHPDKNKHPSAEEYFKEIKEAYETLYDDTKREEYDILYVDFLNYRARMSAQGRETEMDIGISKEVVETVVVLAGGVAVGMAIYYGLKFLFGDSDSKENNEEDNNHGTANDKCKIKNTSSIPKK